MGGSEGPWVSMETGIYRVSLLQTVISCSHLSTSPHTAKQTWELHQLSVTLKEGTMGNINDTKARHTGAHLRAQTFRN